MPLDDHPDDDRPPTGPLPPEDRLWRHPSELNTSPTPPTAWFAAPDPTPAPPRWAARGALVGACLIGATVAIGTMWIARPTRVVERTVPAPTTSSASQTLSFTMGPAPAAKLAAAVAPALAPVRVQRGTTWTSGTGVWLDTAGALAVALPLVADPDRILVTDPDGTTRSGRIAGSDPATGIAVVRVAGSTAASSALVDRPAPKPGAACAIVGTAAPGTGAGSGRTTVAAVVVRAERLRTDVSGLVLQDAIQLDRPVSDDAVGSALVDADGRIVGIVAGNATGRFLGAAVPASTVASVAADLLDDGEVHRAWLGVQATDLDPATAVDLDVPGGARITAVSDGSPAERAGLHVGDVIVGIDHHTVADASDLVVLLRTHRPGAAVRIEAVGARGATTRRVVLGG